MVDQQDISRDSLWLRVGVASVWLATGVMVVSATYRAIGANTLHRLGLPEWLMPLTCAFEVALAFWVALGEPRLLVSPFGMLTKNVPIVAAVVVAYLIEREGYSPRARWLLRGGMASVWITEGLFPKILFQQAEELSIATQTGLAFGRPGTLLLVIGALQVTSGVAVLATRGPVLRWLLIAQAGGLIVLPVVVSWFVPWLWFHPFGPFTKNVPVLLGTLVILRRCSSWS